MSETAAAHRSPFTTSPGSSTPPPSTSPEEGREDLYSFVILSVLNTAIIAIVGLAVWLSVH